MKKLGKLEFNDVENTSIEIYEVSFLCENGQTLIAEIDTDLELTTDETYHSDVYATQKTCDFKKTFFRTKKITLDDEVIEIDEELKNEVEAIAEAKIGQFLIYQSEWF